MSFKGRVATVDEEDFVKGRELEEKENKDKSEGCEDLTVIRGEGQIVSEARQLAPWSTSFLKKREEDHQRGCIPTK